MIELKISVIGCVIVFILVRFFTFSCRLAIILEGIVFKNVHAKRG